MPKKKRFKRASIRTACAHPPQRQDYGDAATTSPGLFGRSPGLFLGLLHGLLIFILTGCAIMGPPGQQESSMEIESSSGDLVGIGEPRPIFKKHSNVSSPTTANKDDSVGLDTKGGIMSPTDVATPKPSSALESESDIASPTTLLQTADPSGKSTVINSELDGSVTDQELASVLFNTYTDELESLQQKLESGQKLSDYQRLTKAELEKKLIALFFLRDRRGHREYRRLLNSLSRSQSTVLTLEMLKAAFFQELGLTEQRNRLLEDLQNSIKTGSHQRFNIGTLKITTPTGNTRRDRSSSPLLQESVFVAGQEIEIAGELKYFKNVTVAAFGGLSSKYRRSFSASVGLFNLKGDLVERRPILLAGNATELTSKPSKDVLFWGRYRLPGDLSSGHYMLELMAVDLEGKATATAHHEFRVR